jgi:FkbM family methyltransferase
MLDTVALTLVDGVRIVVPDSLDLITPYVLREQQDFFEDELPFVRDVLQPGQNVIDIGANYGVYTLPMAQKVGASGHVWAFEPSASTAQFLAQSVAANNFGNVTLQQKAVSSAPGSAQLALNIHPELRSIVHGAVPLGGSETVSLVTLDDCMDLYHWQDIDLIKIDAEGEEVNIVKGGRRFFEHNAPLVQYELRTNAADMNFALIRDFAAIGYDSYRYVPGLNVLVPFDIESPPDSYLLNLFCCNAARAHRLSGRGFLLRYGDLADRSKPLGPSASLDAKHDWRRALARLPYAIPLMSAWESAERGADSTDVRQALSLYACSCDAPLTMAERFRVLEASFLRFKALCEREPSHLRLASLARVAHDYGQRTVVVNALTQLLATIRSTGTFDPKEPFLPPIKRFDSISPGEGLGSWILAAILEQLEQRERFSSFYAGASGLDRLEAIHALGFGSPGMERRLELVRQRIECARSKNSQRSSANLKP